jgi:hypothetical protein
VSFYWPTGNPQYPGSIQFTPNEWQHIVFVWDGTTLYRYKNGSLYGQSSFTPGTSLSDLDIGRYWNNSNYTANAIIDEVRIYNRALSADEVLALYNAGR